MKTCPVCGKEIIKQRGRHEKTFCSIECAGKLRSIQRPVQYIERMCPNCQKVFKADLSQVKAGNYKFCSNQCRFEYMRGENASRYKGGYIRPDGYRQISVDSKLQLEHRHVMETMVGRTLKTNEHVHHKNGDKQDNDPNNLQLKTAQEHVSDHSKGREFSADTRNKMKEFAKTRKRNSHGVFIRSVNEHIGEASY